MIFFPNSYCDVEAYVDHVFKYKKKVPLPFFTFVCHCLRRWKNFYRWDKSSVQEGKIQGMVDCSFLPHKWHIYLIFIRRQDGKYAQTEKIDEIITFNQSCTKQKTTWNIKGKEKKTFYGNKIIPQFAQFVMEIFFLSPSYKFSGIFSQERVKM